MVAQLTTSKLFQANLEKCFIVLANTFDNVSGKFPIGFKIWDTENKVLFENAELDILDTEGNFIGKKRYTPMMRINSSMIG